MTFYIELLSTVWSCSRHFTITFYSLTDSDTKHSERDFQPVRCNYTIFGYGQHCLNGQVLIHSWVGWLKRVRWIYPWTQRQGFVVISQTVPALHDPTVSPMQMLPTIKVAWLDSCRAVLPLSYRCYNTKQVNSFFLALNKKLGLERIVFEANSKEKEKMGANDCWMSTWNGWENSGSKVTGH